MSDLKENEEFSRVTTDSVGKWLTVEQSALVESRPREEMDMDTEENEEDYEKEINDVKEVESGGDEKMSGEGQEVEREEVKIEKVHQEEEVDAEEVEGEIIEEDTKPDEQGHTFGYDAQPMSLSFSHDDSSVLPVEASECSNVTFLEEIHVPNMILNQMPSVNCEKEYSEPNNEQHEDGNYGAKVLQKSKRDFANAANARNMEISVGHAGGSFFVKEENMTEELGNEATTEEIPMDADTRKPNKSFILEQDASGGWDSGTEDDQVAFMGELEIFFRERSMEFKPPKFYGEPLNLLKLFRAVAKLGGYDKVTTCKLWRLVGESFKPPKTCTTVSWTFRIFYEKALLDYERHKTNGGQLNFVVSLTDSPNVNNQASNNQASGLGRARRDAAARAMQGWHSQRRLGNGEVSDPIIKDKNSASLQKREKQLKNIGAVKRKKPSAMEIRAKGMRSKATKTQLETTIIDIGPPADWVKINVRITKDCYEVYALVPGLLREEVRLQSDPAGRLVITGKPDNPENHWGVMPFKKVVSLPSRIDPHQTSAVVTLHGQLFVRVPFEQSD